MEQSARVRLAVWLGMVGVGVELCISANLLTWLGIPYVTDGGTLLIKLHPGTDIEAFALLVLLAGRDSWVFLATDKLLASFLFGMTACLAYLLLLTGTGNMVVLLDTFLPAGMLAIVLQQANAGQLNSLACAMRLLVAANALLALSEVMTHATLIPLFLNNAVYHPHPDDFRPTALFDHPLTGSLMSMMGLVLTPKHHRLRLPYEMLMWASLVAYGGRMALMTSLLMVMIAWVFRTGKLILTRDVRAQRVLLSAAAMLAVALPLAGFALAIGLGTRIATHLYWDDSAQVRLAQWQLLDQLDGWQLLFGTRRDDLLSLLIPLHLGYGVEVIENFWLLMFVSLGLVGFPMFLISLGTLVVWCWRKSLLEGRLLLFSTLLVSSTSNSLGRKSTVLVCLVGAVACLSNVTPSMPVRRARWLPGRYTSVRREPLSA